MLCWSPAADVGHLSFPAMVKSGEIAMNTGIRHDTGPQHRLLFCDVPFRTADKKLSG